MEYVVALAVVGGFAYFVYTKVKKGKAERAARKGSGTRGGGRPRDEQDQFLRK